MSAKGAYTLPELARLVGIPTDRARRWFNGKGIKGGKRVIEPFFKPDHERVDGVTILSFLNLIDALVASKLYEFGVRASEIKRVYKILQEDYGVEHAFCRQDLLTDGKKIIIHLESGSQAGLFEVAGGQRLFEEVMIPCLHRIEYSEHDRLASRWRIADGIMIDPRFKGGQPVLERTRVAAETISDAYRANGRDAQLIANWFRLTVQEVLEADRFSRLQLAA